MNAKILFLLPLFFFCIPVSATIRIIQINTDAPRCYEKYEVVYDLLGLSYDNPYDPEQIDVTAIFTSPSGVQWRLFGFYDDYNGANKWKIRFAPNEIGQWSYIIKATDATSSDESDLQTFTAVASAHHGWIKRSEENPRYMQYDDGTSFYGVGMYTPWRNSVNTFDTLVKYGGNTFAIWNITYGGMVNGFGLIEEELGRYNQTKCGKIDELIEV
ncbi:DUF5060 domain-containing protein, partial [candidate division KSB1 bacterium]|nr:DUF5060 domain-containing protein [candidate division KSB1 bacterium]